MESFSLENELYKDKLSYKDLERIIKLSKMIKSYEEGHNMESISKALGLGSGDVNYYIKKFSKMMKSTKSSLNF
jgi:DNA-binding MarR family transcriptional regulator